MIWRIIMDNNFKYLNAINYIKVLIDSERLKENEKLPTENELTQILNVSRITVQKAFNELIKEGIVYRSRGKGTFVSKRECKYDKAKINSFRFIGVVFPVEREKGISYNILRGIQDYTKKRNCYVTIHNSSMDVNEEKRVVRQLLDDGACGVIVQCVNTNDNLKLYRDIIKEKYPLVFIDRCPENLNADFVSSDNYMGAYMIVNYLVNLGHKNIAFISDQSKSINTVKDRFNGYYDALTDNGIKIEDSFIKIKDCSPNFSPQLVENAVDELMNQDVIPTAIFAINDYVALNCINKITKMGFNVPNDISVVGFDNKFNGDHLLVPMTTIEQPLYKMGAMAAKFVFRRLRYRDVYYNHIYLPVNMIIGESAGICRQVKE